MPKGSVLRSTLNIREYQRRASRIRLLRTPANEKGKAMRVTRVLAILALLFSELGQAQADMIVAWGANGSSQVSNVPTGSDFTAIAGVSKLAMRCGAMVRLLHGATICMAK